MSDKHLSDEHLARLVDGENSVMDEAAWEHLATCRVCFSAFSEAVETKQRWLEEPGSFTSPEHLLKLARAVPDGRVEAGSREASRPFLSMKDLRPRAMQVAGLALAASLLFALLLPPRPAGVLVAQRGDDDPRFTRPVEGEILPPGHRILSWTPISGVTNYQVSLRDSRGDLIWEGSSSEPGMSLPEDVSLSRGVSYKALLSVQPADLLPLGRTSVAFRVDTYPRVCWHRLIWASRWIQIMGIVSVALLAVLAFRGGRGS